MPPRAFEESTTLVDGTKPGTSLTQIYVVIWRQCATTLYFVLSILNQRVEYKITVSDTQSVLCEQNVLAICASMHCVLTEMV